MSKTIVLDTNLLVLLIVGLTNERYIAMHKRLKAYNIDDFKLLVATMADSDGLVVTPNTLSETSNLLRQISDPAKSAIHAVFRNFIQRSAECYVKSNDAVDRPEFVRLGLSDMAILEVAKDDVLILSADLDLCVAAEMAEYPVMNFNHIRDAYYGSRR